MNFSLVLCFLNIGLIVVQELIVNSSLELKILIAGLLMVVQELVVNSSSEL